MSAASFAAELKLQSNDSAPPLIPRVSANAQKLQALHNLNQDEDSLYANQILDVFFQLRPEEKLGFGIRIDEEKKMLQITTVNKESQAHTVGLKHGDIILAVNDENVGNNPQIGIEQIQKCKNQSPDENELISIRISVCRRVFEHIMVTIRRSGIGKCDGKYVFAHLDDDYDSPVFMNEETQMLLLKSNYDTETGESLWAICDETHTFYIGVSNDLLPPNDSWMPIKKVGKYPCPGLVFYNTQQRLVDIEEKESESKELSQSVTSQNDTNKVVSFAQKHGGSSQQKHSRVFKTIHSQRLLIGLDGIDDLDNDEDLSSDKYKDLLAKYNESEENVTILRDLMKDLNVSFYEYWLKDKQKQRECDKLLKIVGKQKLEIDRLKKIVSDQK